VLHSNNISKLNCFLDILHTSCKIKRIVLVIHLIACHSSLLQCTLYQNSGQHGLLIPRCAIEFVSGLIVQFRGQEGSIVSSAIYDHWWHFKTVALNC